MYQDNYLLSSRKAYSQNNTFICRRVVSEYRKQVVYTVNIKITSYSAFQIHSVNLQLENVLRLTANTYAYYLKH